MRAVRCHELTGPAGLHVDEVPEPTAGAGEVSIEVRAAGVNFPDLLLTCGKYQFKPPPPFVPGGEVSGVVRAVGKGVTSVAPGDRVAAVMIGGGWAEVAVVPELAVTKLPEAIGFEVGASLLVNYGTTLHALVDRADLRPNETLLVLGAGGGVGIAAVELGALLGARVIAAASTEEKLTFAKQRGATMTIDYSREDLKKQAKALSGGGVDVIYDPVGGAYSEPALRAMAWRGRYLVIGFAAGEIPKVPLNLPLLTGSSIVGVFWGSAVMREPEKIRANNARLVAWVEAGRLKPHVDAALPLEQASEALGRIEQRLVKGKLVLVP